MIPRLRTVPLGARVQDLRRLNLVNAQINLTPGRLSFRCELKPNLYARSYKVHIQLSGHPTALPDIFVEEPDLRILANDEKIPHTYPCSPEHGVKLCLWHPGSNEWTQAIPLSQSVIPWTVLWLTYFELWLSSGIWEGGGLHNGKLEHWDTTEGKGQYAQ